jgi:hypothetical protein
MSEPDKHLRRGTKGLTGRVLDQPPIGRATVRSALQRVGRKVHRDGPSPEAKPTNRPAQAARKSGPAAQAALGMMGRGPADFDDDSLRSWLKAMSADELKKLSKLIWTARQEDPAAPRSAERPPFEKVARQLESQGMNFSINANTVVINVGESAAKRAPYQPSLKRKDYHGDWGRDWGRSWGRVKDFINGH